MLKIALYALYHLKGSIDFNPIALRKTKIAYNFGGFKCNRVSQTCTNISLGAAKELIRFW